MRYAERLGYATVSLGEVVRQARQDRGHDDSTAEFVLRTHETAGRAQFAREAVADLKQQLADCDEPPAGVVVEGVQSRASVRSVQKAFGQTSVVWILAPQSLRLQRLRHREDGYTSQNLFQRDLRELNSGLSELASPLGHDYSVCNDGSLRQFKQRLDVIFE